jgi:broad specificity phosphatase PhoE
VRRLILVRHSCPEVVPGTPSDQWRLSEEGRRRCERLAEWLTGCRFERIYASREAKAQETAYLVVQRLGVSIETVDGLHEQDRSDVTAWIPREAFERRIKRLFERPSEPVFGQETADAAYERYARAVNQVVAGSEDRDVVIVSHGTVMSLLAGRANGIDPFALWSRLGLPSIIVLSLPDLSVGEIVERLGEEAAAAPHSGEGG